MSKRKMPRNRKVSGVFLLGTDKYCRYNVNCAIIFILNIKIVLHMEGMFNVSKKKKLTIDEQILDLESKGVSFEHMSKEEAKRFLRYNTINEQI